MCFSAAARIAFLIVTPAIALAADWSYFRSGPLEVWTDGDDDPARAVLATFDQVGHWTARILGRQEIQPMWPVRIVLSRRPGPHRSASLRRVRDGYIAGLGEKEPIPRQWLAGYVRILLADDAKPLPATIERGLVALLSTAEVTNSRILLGKPPETIDRAWAHMHLLLVEPNYAGRSRVFFTNLQQGAEYDVACRNAFEKTGKEMDAEVDRYWSSGQFEPQTVSGKPLDPRRDYRQRPGDAARAGLLLADLLEGEAARKAYLALLNQAGKNPEAMEGAGMFAEAIANGSQSAPAWVQAALAEKDRAKARSALQKAMQLNPRWAEPHARWAELETEPAGKIAPLKKAADLEPRNTSYWTMLAEAQIGAQDFVGANQSWRMAERYADDQVRDRIAERRRNYEQQRADLEAAHRRRQEEERQRELKRLEGEALANIRRAEAKANDGSTPVDPKRKVVEWWDGPKAAQVVIGTLERIDCARGPARWIVKQGAKMQTLTVPDASKVVVVGTNQATFSCGPQRPPRRVKVESNEKGEVLTVEFP